MYFNDVNTITIYSRRRAPNVFTVKKKIILYLMEIITMCLEYIKTLINIVKHNYFIIRGYMFRPFKRSSSGLIRDRVNRCCVLDFMYFMYFIDVNKLGSQRVHNICRFDLLEGLKVTV